MQKKKGKKEVSCSFIVPKTSKKKAKEVYRADNKFSEKEPCPKDALKGIKEAYLKKKVNCYYNNYRHVEQKCKC